MTAPDTGAYRPGEAHTYTPNQWAQLAATSNAQQHLGIVSQGDNIDLSWFLRNETDVWKFPTNSSNPMLDRPMTILRTAGPQVDTTDEHWEKILEEILAVYPEDLQGLYHNPPAAQMPFFDALTTVLENTAKALSLISKAEASLQNEEVRLGMTLNAHLPEVFLSGAAIVGLESINDAHALLTVGIGRNDANYDNMMNITRQTGDHLNKLSDLLADENSTPEQFAALSNQISQTLSQASTLLNDTPLQYLNTLLSSMETICGMASLEGVSPWMAIGFHAATVGGDL